MVITSNAAVHPYSLAKCIHASPNTSAEPISCRSSKKRSPGKQPEVHRRKDRRLERNVRVEVPSTPELRGVSNPGETMNVTLPEEQISIPTVHSPRKVPTVTYKRVLFDAKDEPWDSEMLAACKKLEIALAVRRKWTPEFTVSADNVQPSPVAPFDPFGGPLPKASNHTLVWSGGQMTVHERDGDSVGEALFQSPGLTEFLTDFLAVMSITATPEVKSFSYK